MKDYLIKFDYDYYCQGYEKDTISVLVRANNFEEAIEKCDGDLLDLYTYYKSYARNKD